MENPVDIGEEFPEIEAEIDFREGKSNEASNRVIWVANVLETGWEKLLDEYEEGEKSANEVRREFCRWLGSFYEQEDEVFLMYEEGVDNLTPMIFLYSIEEEVYGWIDEEAMEPGETSDESKDAFGAVTNPMDILNEYMAGFDDELYHLEGAKWGFPEFLEEKLRLRSQLPEPDPSQVQRVFYAPYLGERYHDH